MLQRNHGGLNAPGLTHFAVGPVEIRPTGGAVVTDVYVLHADAAQPVGVKPLEINVPLAAAALHIGVGLVTQRITQRRGNVVVCFKAARSDGCADGAATVTIANKFL